MNPLASRNLVRHEEDSSRQFKEDVTNADSPAAESLSAPLTFLDPSETPAMNKSSICKTCGITYEIDDSCMLHMSPPDNYSSGCSSHCLACWLGVGPIDSPDERPLGLLNLASQLTLPCADDGRVFTRTDRIARIHELLNAGTYQVMAELPLAFLYAHSHFDPSLPFVLVSTHVDSLYKRYHASLQDGVHLGTFDNSITNAAAIHLMRENRLHPQVLVAFTGDEEEDSRGADQVILFLQSAHPSPLLPEMVIVLDITEEAYDKHPFTLENLFCRSARSPKKHLRFNSTKRLKAFLQCCLQPIIPHIIVKGAEDESWQYDDHDLDCFAFCLPCQLLTDDMHDDEGVHVKSASFIFFTNALESLARRLLNRATPQEKKSCTTTDDDTARLTSQMARPGRFQSVSRRPSPDEFLASITPPTAIANISAAADFAPQLYGRLAALPALQGRSLFYPGAGSDISPALRFVRNANVSVVVYADYGRLRHNIEHVFRKFETHLHCSRDDGHYHHWRVIDEDRLRCEDIGCQSPEELYPLNSHTKKTSHRRSMWVERRSAEGSIGRWILLREDSGDESPQKELLFLYLTTEAIQTYLQLWGRHRRAPFTVVAQNHGKGGFWTHLTGDCLLYAAASRLPDFLYVGDISSTPWPGYRKISRKVRDRHSEHKSKRDLWECTRPDRMNSTSPLMRLTDMSATTIQSRAYPEFARLQFPPAPDFPPIPRRIDYKNYHSKP